MLDIELQDFIPGSKRAYEVSPVVAIAYCLKTVSRTLLWTWELKHNPVVSLIWGERDKKSGKTKEARIYKNRRNEMKRALQRSAEFTPWVWLNIIICTYIEETTKIWERSTIMHLAEQYLELT